MIVGLSATMVGLATGFLPFGWTTRITGASFFLGFIVLVSAAHIQATRCSRGMWKKWRVRKQLRLESSSDFEKREEPDDNDAPEI